jgi:drug/metabolite transporter (DMT)-like permease
MLTGLLCAIGAMLLNSVAGLLESDATRRVSRRRPLIAQPRYLGGLLVDGMGWVVTVVALRHLPVFAVQAVLGATIAVTALAARALYGSVLRTVDRIAMVACLIGLVLVAGSAGSERPSVVSWTADLVLSVALALVVVAACALWHSGRVWPLAVVAGLGFGGTSLAIRAVQLAGDGDVVVQLLAQPTSYLVLGFAAAGLACYSRALGLGSLAQVTAVFLVTEVIVPGLVGIGVLGDSVRPGWWLPMVAGLLLAVLGVLVLARSPARQPPPARPGR